MADEHLKAVISADSSQLRGELESTAQELGKLERQSESFTAHSEKAWKGLAKGMLHAGSTVAIISRGIKSLIDIFQQLQKAATEALLAIVKTNTANQRGASDWNFKRASGAQQALREYWEAWRKNEANPSNESEARLQQMRKDFRRRYGEYDLDLTSSDMEGELRRGLELTQKRRTAALEAELASLNKAQDKLDENLKDKGNFRRDEVKQMQAEKNLNAARIRELTEQLHDLEKEDPTNGMFGIAKAQDADIAAQKAAEAQKEREATAAKLAKEREQRGRELLAAQKAYLDAQKREAQAIRELADTERQLARERRAAAIDARRERLQSRMSRFGFSPYEGFDMDESNPDRLRRRRQQRLDATIADKMARQESGGRVYYTNRERERIGEYERLRKQDSALQAAQKQMDAADRQRQASETMLRAVNALSESRNATRLAADGYGQAVTALNNTLQQMLHTTYLVR